ncbi:MAG: pilus assembly protein TadG-related protein [Nocardioidaceae bacterium]
MVRVTGTPARHRRDESGALAIIVAVSAVMIFVLAALVVDLGLARDTDRQAQNSADAAALAAGNALYTVGKTPHFDAAVTAAKEYAAANFGVVEDDWVTCTDSGALSYRPSGGTPCISFDSATAPTEVRVIVPPRTVDTPLAGVIGSTSVDVSAVAQMKLRPDAPARCALCVIGAGPHDLQNGDVVVQGGDVHFNGNVSVGPNGLVATDGSITVQGSAGGGYDRYDPDPLQGQPAMPDPLAFMPPIAYDHLPLGSQPCSFGSGRYGAFSSSCSALPGGLYVITGEWKFTGDEDLIGSGVTLYFTCGSAAAPRPCAPGEAGGWLNAAGNGNIRITAPSTGATRGLAIVYDRNNKSPLHLTGGSGSAYSGTIYAPASTLDYRGNGAGTTDSLIVVGGLAFSGDNATLRPSYDGESNVEMPPSELHLSQ